MTLDEAIEHAKQVARTCEDDQCAAEHIQLAEWLRTARGAEVAGRWYTAKMRELQAENAKLRELVKRMFDRVNYECRCCSIFCSDWDEDNECCVFATSMRELGVEVE